MKKRILAMLMVLAMLLPIIPLQSFAAEVTELLGSGTSDAPYQIGTADELVFAAEQMNANDPEYVGKSYILTKDIDMSSVSSFPMITSFTGELDGNGKTISNLKVTDDSGSVVTTDYGIGFIYKLSGRVSDLTFDNADIYSNVDASANGYSGAAVVAAEITTGGMILSVTVKNSLVDAPLVPKTGGITSMNARAAKKGTVIGIIRNCVVRDTTLIGGPRSAGNKYGLMMGGIAGYSATSNIENCLVINVTMQAANENTCPFYAAMICGYGAGGNIEGNVVVSGKIERTNANQLFSSVKVGGIVSAKNATSGGAFTGSYANLIDTENTPAIPAGAGIAGTPATSVELKAMETYTSLGWDFDEVWEMKDEYPNLKDPSNKGALKLEGTGTADDPYLIADKDDLLYAAEYLNNHDERIVGKNLKLTADIDLADVNFTPIDKFDGTFDGDGYTLKNFTINDTATSDMGGEYRVAFIRTNNGTVKNLNFASPRISTTALSTGGNSGAAVIVGDNAHGAMITACVVSDAVVYAPHLPKAAGIAVLNARTTNINATISRSVFEGELTCGPRAGSYGPMMGGIAAYSATSTIEYCISDTDLIYKGNDSITSANIYAGIICGYANRVTFRSNVAYGGSVTIDTEIADQRLATVYAPISYSQTLSNNISCEDITLNGEKIEVSDNSGSLVKADDLTKQETYEEIGYDFYLFWEMTDKYPLPLNPDNKGDLKLEGTGTKEDPYLIANKEDLGYAIAFLNILDERIVGKALKLTADIDLAGVNFTPIEKFDGILDGDGHTIYNFTINETTTQNGGDNYCVAFIRTNNGTVKNLNFVSPRISTTVFSSGGFSGAAVIVGENAHGSLVSSCVVKDAVVYAPNLPKAAGIAVLNSRTPGVNATISRSVFEGELTCGPRAGTYGPMLGGIAAYSATSTIEYCISDTDITYKGNDSITSANIYAGIICGFANGVNFRSNVAYGGSVVLESEIADQRLAAIYAPISHSQIFNNNIAWDGITLGGTVIEASDNNGRIVTSDELILQETYEKIGFNFDLLWEMTASEAYPDKHPVPTIVDYTNNEINRITANVKGDTAIGFTFHYLEDKDMVVRVSENESFADSFILSAVGEGSVYKAEAKDLKKATTYYYRAEGDGKTSPIGSFTTDDGELSFISISDTEVQSFSDASQVAINIAGALYANSDVDFILHSGDMASDSRGEEGWQDLIYQAQDSFLSKPFVPTVGEEDKVGLFSHFSLDNSYYSFDYANAHIIVIDTNTLDDEQIEWLKADATATDRDWVILSMHRGPYTSGISATTQAASNLRQLFIDELDDIGIDLVIQGHDHIMGHTYDLHDGEVTSQPVYTETINGKRFNYTVDPEGVVYMMSGVMGTEYGKQMSCDDLDAYIMQFERSDGRGNVPTYAEVTVTDDRIEVATYEIKADMQPTMIEGFGIDRAIGKVESIIASGDYTTARDEFNKLSSAQKNEVPNYSELIANEGGNELRENGAAWLETDATERRSIVVTNDSTVDFNYAPVLVKLENAPSEQMAFYTTEGEALPYEVESYNAKGISYVWVNVPHIGADSVATLWVYFGVNGIEDRDAVWVDSYALVEHFDDISDAAMHGKVTTEILNGDAVGKFDGESALTYTSIGDDFNHMTVSAVVQMEAGTDIHRSGIVSKYNKGNPEGKNTYLLGVDTEGMLRTYYGATWWRTNEVVTQNYITEYIADGQPHLITLTYDGFTIETFIDGKCVAWETVLIENATFLAKEMLTTIGAYSDLERPFTGNIYDVQINGARLTDQWEAFRYDNYFGDAVIVGAPESKGSLAITVGSAEGTSEAGNQAVSGIVSKDSSLTAKVNGNSIDLGEVKAGAFTVYVPVSGTGDSVVTITATANGESVEAELTLNAVDTTAPEKPGISVSDDNKTLTADTKNAEGDEVTVDFYVNKTITLNETNTMVAEGSTDAKTPVEINPEGMDYAAITDSLTTTTSDASNPYQIYKIALSDEEAAIGSWRFVWQGSSNRQLHAYGYDHTSGTWIKLASTEGSGILNMNIDMNGEGYVDKNIIYLMIFRGMGEELAELDSFIPDEGQYDFTIFWNSDTQYLGQFAPEMLYHQHQWIADNYEDKKGVLTFNTGDVANRTNLNYEYNWEVVDESYSIFEEAGIPYTFNWGNHDITYDGQPNETRYYRTYFPTSRMEANAGGWEVSFAPEGDGGTTRAMSYKQTINGAKIMILSLAYNPRLTESDLVWAEETLAAHPDYTVIIITHNYASNSKILDTNIRTRLADVYSNVKVVLCGHLDGTAAHKDANGSFVILQDYQGESGKVKHGGNEFLKLIQFDVENDLIYFNTYSPLTGETLSPIGENSDVAAEGLYQKNGDEFALNIELNGDTERSFTTTSLNMSSGDPAATESIAITEGESASFTPKGLTEGTEYSFYTVLTDTSGNETVSDTILFTATHIHVEAITEAVDPTCTEVGYTEGRYCEVCGEILVAQEEIKASGHNYEGEWTVAKEADYGVEGEEILVCADCDCVLETRVIASKLFSDVTDPSKWYYNAVYYCAANGYIAGNNKGEFMPNGQLTREQFVVILARTAGADLSQYTESDFTDVKAASWYGPSVIWAATEGYVNGIGGGKFGTGQNMTREQLATMFYRYADKAGIDVTGSAELSMYTDEAKISSWAKTACAWAVDAGLIKSTNTAKLTLAPKMTVTRAQAAQIFMNYDENVVVSE